MRRRAIVLLSGGLDSSTCLAVANSQGYDCYALTIDYDQKSQAEINAASELAQKFHAIEHRIMTIPMGALGGSALTDAKIPVPNYTGDKNIPVTYVPARNTIMLAIALGWAEIVDAKDIFIGVNALDYSGYPDCRPEYIRAFQQMANLATKAGIEGRGFRIQTPLIDLTKAAIIKLGTRLGLDYRLTVSCYQADSEGHACGKCDSCTLRKKGFKEANLPDPTRYQETSVMQFA